MMHRLANKLFVPSKTLFCAAICTESKVLADIFLSGLHSRLHPYRGAVTGNLNPSLLGIGQYLLA